MKTDLVVNTYIFHENKVLLIHHKKLDLWLGVGGHIDQNEIPDDAVLREVKEETNLDVELISTPNLPLVGNMKRHCALPFYTNVHEAMDHDHYCLYYICKTGDPSQIKTDPNEVIGHKWFAESELDDSRIPADVKMQAQLAFRILRQ